MSATPYRLHLPGTIEQAIGLAKSFDGDSAFLAGGTDLLVNVSEKLSCKGNLISLAKIGALKEIGPSGIGAGVTIAELVRKRDLLPPVIGQTAKLIAGPALRESATVGGNLLLNGRCMYFNQTQLSRCSQGACMKAEGRACIAVPQSERCYAPFSGDLAAVFLALDADFVLAGPQGRRVVRAAEFYLNDGIHANVLASAEILVKVKLPEDAPELSCGYRKLRPRSAVDFPEAGVALAVKRNGGKNATELRVAISALGPAPTVTVLQADEFKNLKAGEIAEKCWKEVSPAVLAVRNTSFSPTYRREMARLFIEQLLEELLA